MPKTQIKYAIRQKSTDFYLPQPEGRNGRGGSWVDPVALDGWWNVRLFHTKPAAKIALRAWLKGRYVCHRTKGYYSMGLEADIEPEETTTIERVDSRNPEDMEVVSVTITFPRKARTKRK